MGDNGQADKIYSVVGRRALFFQMKADLDRIPPALREAGLYVERKLHSAGYAAYLVGGSVRDLLTGRRISDLDFTTDAHPQKVLEIFERTVPVGVEFGTVLVLYKNISIEVTTYRHDMHYEDGRRPSVVQFGDSLEDDVIRRDFTINGMAVLFSDGQIIDYVGGLRDLKKKRIRTIGKALTRFNEDGLRPIRGCRFSAALGFEIEDETYYAMKQCLQVTSLVAHERFYDEWRKTLKIKNRHIFWHLLRDTGILNLFFQQAGHFNEDRCWQRTMQLLQVGRVRTMGTYAALLMTLSGDELPATRALLKDLKFPQKESKRCLALLQTPLLPLSEGVMPDIVTLKKYFSEVDSAELTHHLRFAVDLGKFKASEKGSVESYERFEHDLVEIYHRIIRERVPLRAADLAVNGHDLKEAGFKGREIGDCLSFLLEKVHAEPELNSREALLKEVVRFRHRY